MHESYLRPRFTRELAKRLLHAGSVNLISPHGQGRRRTLADLRTLLGDSMQLLQANIRNYPHSASQLVHDLCHQAGCSDGTLEALSKHLVQGNRRWLIILHNIDELHPGNSSGFNDSFFNALNSIAGLSAVALLCVSEYPVGDWPLSTDPLPLPPLSVEQLQAEIKRRNPGGSESERESLASWLSQQAAPYSLLDERADDRETG